MHKLWLFLCPQLGFFLILACSGQAMYEYASIILISVFLPSNLQINWSKRVANFFKKYIFQIFGKYIVLFFTILTFHFIFHIFVPNSSDALHSLRQSPQSVVHYYLRTSRLLSNAARLFSTTVLRGQLFSFKG